MVMVGLTRHESEGRSMKDGSHEIAQEAWRTIIQRHFFECFMVGIHATASVICVLLLVSISRLSRGVLLSTECSTIAATSL